jgi:anti-sigma regulatory factor (Ser/Thr protein kinase)
MAGQPEAKTPQEAAAAEAAAADGGSRHLALLYRDEGDYLAAARRFVSAGLDRAEPVLVAVPQPTMAWLRRELPGGGQVSFADMTELGRNPARIIPSVLAFAAAHAGQRIRYLGEPAWPGRSPAELREIARHEALNNLAFTASPATLMCAYDRAGLPGPVITDAGGAHPALVSDGRERPSGGYPGPGAPPGAALAPAPATARALGYHRDLRPVRALVAAGARRAGLPADRATDLVIAVSEVAANTLRHTASGGTVWLWQQPGEVICQVHDTGQITDPLAGSRHPAGDLPGGKGLWLVNQVCDLVELATGTAGTTLRLHMRLP